MSPLKVSLFGGSPLSPSTRFRFGQYLPYLKKNGVEVNYFTSVPFPHIPSSDSTAARLYFNVQRYLNDLYSLKKRFSQIRLLSSQSNVACIHSFLTPFIDKPFLENSVSKLAVRLVIDLDDAIFETNRRTAKKVKSILKLSDSVIVGNEYLANFAEKYQKNIHIIPTPIDTDVYTPSNSFLSNDRKVITIGWMGGWVNIQHLEDLYSVFKKIRLDLKDRVRIVAISNIESLPSPLNEVVELQKWSPHSEIADLQSFDIGLMPLKDNEFTKGKCSFKLLQYMSMGKPVVASPVGMNKQVVSDNGFLCTSEDEWLQALLILCEDENLRTNLGKKSRKNAEKNYSTKVLYSQFYNVLVG